MNIEVLSLDEWLAKYPTKVEAAKSLGVPFQYFTFWKDKGIIMVNGQPFRPIKTGVVDK
jgi:hypothetical protein